MDPSDPSVFEQVKPVEERVLAGDELDAALTESSQPFIVRGLVADWPLVQAAKCSANDAMQYLLLKARDVPFDVSVGAPGTDGRLFYDKAMQMNFRMARAKLPEIFEQLAASEGREEAHPLYLGSIDVRQFFPGLHEENCVDLGTRDVLASIWIGTKTRIAAHNDFPKNLACVVAGRRRFTVFSPDQFRNLYLGPIDNTPAGRAISMVDFHQPDYERFPLFREALSHGQTAELEPGDAIFIPSMWWHHVEGLAPFNILLNYWWRETPRWLGQPQDVLNHAIMTIRDLPDEEKEHWRALFDHYVFRNDESSIEHIPEHGRSILGRMTPENASRIRTFLLRQLSR